MYGPGSRRRGAGHAGTVATLTARSVDRQDAFWVRRYRCTSSFGPLGHLFLSPSEALFQPVCLRWSCLNDAYCGLKLNRLDLCLDVRDVKDQAIWRAVVAGTRQPRLAHKDTRFDNYISASSGARGVRFVVYDKHSEAAASNAPRTARPPEGTMRVEAQLHKTG